MVGDSLVLVAAKMYHKMSQENMLEEENMKLGGKLNSCTQEVARNIALLWKHEYPLWACVNFKLMKDLQAKSGRKKRDQSNFEDIVLSFWQWPPYVIHVGIYFNATAPHRLHTFKPLKLIDTVPLGSIHYQKCIGAGGERKVGRVIFLHHVIRLNIN